MPTSNEVVALIVGDFDAYDIGRDIVVQYCSGQLERIHETHTSFIPLQYPLLFPFGEDGFQEDIPLRDFHSSNASTRRMRVTLREFIAFQIQDRLTKFENIVRAGRLFQQFLVDSYIMIEAQRLSYIHHNQASIRSDVLKDLEEAVSRSEIDPSTTGMRIILPALFTRGMRYMFNNCQDAISICKKYGYPDVFITITCNSSWLEIRRFIVDRELRVEDRPNISCRVCKIKLDKIITNFKKGIPFGKVDAGIYTVEFQQRGLPHAHILLWLNGENKITSIRQIDQLMSAELLDPNQNPRLHMVVSSYMVHGPCGRAFSSSPCMKEGFCSKFYPKKFRRTVVIDEDGYPTYRRRNSGISTYQKGVQMDNRHVIPYNPTLLMIYEAHVNMEYCNKSNSMKYLFKYINKGPNRVTTGISRQSTNDSDNQLVDEIKRFYDCRYLLACEAIWRILAFDIH